MRRLDNGKQCDKVSVMKITPSIEEMAAIGFLPVARMDKRIEVKNRKVSFVASITHDACGNPTQEYHWAGYNGGYFVAGWTADSTADAINTLINEERHDAYHEGKDDMRREFKELLGIKD
jgi:hypothetical protein